ncbi:MAG: type II toxin-antitoxin system mRNA interferase toxin, RelE/StbE family [Patescibacteria group bacterium]|nr:type II toxin-antitoxin system mRNA interferase toxin, RelE/StbE family [Patescibacteria group bacterium]
MEIKFTRNFKKRYKKAPKDIQKAFNRRLALFEKNNFHPALRNHALQGKYRNYRSVNITGDWRAIFKQNGKDSGLVIFAILGTHSELYK